MKLLLVSIGVMALAMGICAAAADPYWTTTGRAVYTYQRAYAIGPLPECVDVFNTLAVGQLFNCNQTSKAGTAAISVANNTFAISLWRADYETWTCWNKRATKYSKIFTSIPWDAAAGIYDGGDEKDPYRKFFNVGLAAMCISLERALYLPSPDINTKATMAIDSSIVTAAASNAVPYVSTWGGTVWTYRRACQTAPIPQCNGLFKYLQAHQVMTCSRDAGGTLAYFTSSNDTLGVSISYENGIDVDCANLSGGNPVVLTKTIMSELANAIYNNDIARFQSGLAAACIMLDPALV